MTQKTIQKTLYALILLTLTSNAVCADAAAYFAAQLQTKKEAFVNEKLAQVNNSSQTVKDQYAKICSHYFDVCHSMRSDVASMLSFNEHQTAFGHALHPFAVSIASSKWIELINVIMQACDKAVQNGKEAEIVQIVGGAPKAFDGIYQVFQRHISNTLAGLTSQDKIVASKKLAQKMFDHAQRLHQQDMQRVAAKNIVLDSSAVQAYGASGWLTAWKDRYEHNGKPKTRFAECILGAPADELKKRAQASLVLLQHAQDSYNRRMKLCNDAEERLKNAPKTNS